MQSVEEISKTFSLLMVHRQAQSLLDELRYSEECISDLLTDNEKTLGGRYGTPDPALTQEWVDAVRELLGPRSSALMKLMEALSEFLEDPATSTPQHEYTTNSEDLW